MIKNTILVPSYTCKVIVLIGTINETNKKINDICTKYKIKGSPGYVACVLVTGSIKTYYLVFSKEYLSLSTISHEIAHLSAFIFNHRKKKIRGDSEPFAELNELLAKEIDKILTKHKLKLHRART